METLFELPKEKETSKKPALQGKARVQEAQRQQMEMRMMSLDELLAGDHIARMVWAVVEQMDLECLYAAIQSVEGNAGRPATDPRLLVAVWLFATLEEVGSARQLDKLCTEHIAYQWLLGGVKVNYHTLSDFRVGHETLLDDLLTQGVAALLAEGLVHLKRTAQDGMRVRAHAGTRSFRRRATLEKHWAAAKERVEQMKQQSDPEEEPVNRRKQAAQKRACKERVARLGQALQELSKMELQKKKAHRKRSKRKEPRCSSSDPEARIMKQSDGGYRPNYNVQLAVDTESGIITGADVVNEVDQGQLSPMLAQMERRYKRTPQEHLVDGGFVSFTQLEEAHQKKIIIYAPLPRPNKTNPDPTQPKPKDGPGVRAWRERMATEAAKPIYKLRAATIEWANARIRSLGMYQVNVRGKKKVRAVLLWFALAHNLLRAHALRLAAA
jgi:transposase